MEIERISQKAVWSLSTRKTRFAPDDAQENLLTDIRLEAELAVEKSQVKPLGIVSMGSMEWLGKVTKTRYKA